jgi:hypothetical protein
MLAEGSKGLTGVWRTRSIATPAPPRRIAATTNTLVEMASRRLHEGSTGWEVELEAIEKVIPYRSFVSACYRGGRQRHDTRREHRPAGLSVGLLDLEDDLDIDANL